MMGHKICFYEEIWIIIPKSSSLLLLIWSTAKYFILRKMAEKHCGVTHTFLMSEYIVTIHFRLEEIGAAAAKEYSLEKALEKMKFEWKDVCFEMIPYRETVSASSVAPNS